MQPYDVYAVLYATDDERSGTDCFISGDPHDGPGTLAYYVWAVVGPDRTWVVDTGMTREHAEKRRRTYHRSPAQGLAEVLAAVQQVTGVAPGTSRDLLRQYDLDDASLRELRRSVQDAIR